MIRVENLKKTYQMGEVEVRALDGVSLTVEQGEYVAIIGTSGSGKSTLMHILGLLDVPDSGTFEIDGTDVTHFSDTELAALRNRVMGFVFQQFNLLKRTSALENVGLPLIYARNGKKGDVASRMLTLVGLGDRMAHHTNELSGGQQQRVAIARALVNNPSIIFADEPTGNLDSTSAQEIMAVMSELHARGLTIILVTHDAEVAGHAQRIIEIRDGKVLSDAPNPTAPDVPTKVVTPQTPDEETKSAGLLSMREGWTLVKQSLRSLSANKVRTALSALGIMIGVAAVIATVAVGNGAKAAVANQMSRLGSNLLMVMPQRRSQGGVAQAQGTVSRLSLSDVEAIRNEVANVVRISPTIDGNVQMKFGNRNWSCRATGVAPDYELMRAYEPQIGRFFTDEEVASKAMVCLLGVTPVRELFDGANPLGQQIKINRRTYTVIGVLPEKGSSGPRDYDDTAFVPVTTAMRRLFGKDYVERIEVQINQPDQMDRAQVDMLALLGQRHRTGSSGSFEVRNLAEIQDAVSETSQVMSLLLSSIASIALVVGGIGIMNIMLVSVTERTREIGLRKALGARGSDIMSQFLIEALIISFFGGCLGIALGAGAGYAVERFFGMTVALTQESIYMAFGFSALIGIVFGLWPARKASQLNPIEALRYE